MRALVVEDEPTSALLSRHVLEQEGFVVDQAITGAEAIALVLATDYDAIILDLGLPDLDGLQVMEAIRREGRTTPVLVLTDGQSAPEALLSMCERAQIPMFATQEPSAFVIDVLRAYLSKHFAERTSMHGVFMDILGLGVLITGESGLGKSELGLELISRGHGLVADDAVDIHRTAQNALEGRCPELLLNLLEVRGIGLLDIKAIFGETAVRRKMKLKLIVHLVRRETMEREHERLPYEPLTQDVLGVAVRKVIIQVVAGRNIAVLVEAAVRNTILQLRGIDTYQEFVERHRRAMEGD